MKRPITSILLAAVFTLAAPAYAHDIPPPPGTDAPAPHFASAAYLGNEGVYVQQGDTRILMDPLYYNGFGVYQMVPERILTPLKEGTGPFAGIDAIFVSHMHPDHFSVGEIITYLERHTETRLYAPADAVEWMREETAPDNPIFARVTSVDLNIGDAPQSYTAGDLSIDVIRVPHAGGARHGDISNLIWRVSLGEGATVMHLGDATPDAAAYAPHQSHFEAKHTTTAFPPYWLLTDEDSHIFVDGILNASRAIGVHVPINAPAELVSGNIEYFHTPGETATLLPAPVE